MSNRNFLHWFDFVNQRYPDLTDEEKSPYIQFEIDDNDKLSFSCDLLDFIKEHKEISIHSNDYWRGKITLSIILPDYVFTEIIYRGEVKFYLYRNLEREELSFDEARKLFESFKNDLPKEEDYKFPIYGQGREKRSKFKVKEFKNAFEILGFSNDYSSLLTKALKNHREVLDEFLRMMIDPYTLIKETDYLMSEVESSFRFSFDVTSEQDYLFRLFVFANKNAGLYFYEDYAAQVYAPAYNTIKLGNCFLNLLDQEENKPILKNLYLPLAVPSFLNLYLNGSPFVSELAANWTYLEEDEDEDCEIFIRGSQILDLFKKYGVEEKLDYVLDYFEGTFYYPDYQGIGLLKLRNRKDLTELKRMFPTFIKFHNWPFHLRMLLWELEERSRPLSELMGEKIEIMAKEEAGIN